MTETLKPSAVEHAAIQNKRKEFISDMRKALEPVFQKHTGITNSGTYAFDVATAAEKTHRASLDREALLELSSRLEWLFERMRESENDRGQPVDT